MNYGQVKLASLRLINSASIAGTGIALTYNNQADYVQAIPLLVDDAQMYIATTVRPIAELVALEELPRSDSGSFWVYTLPENCWRIMHGGLIWSHENDIGQQSIDRFHDYRFYGKDKLFVPKRFEGLALEYYRYPQSVGSDPDDLVELDNTPDTHAAIPYYVAAHLVMYDDSFRYASLYNEFETRLGRLGEPLRTEIEPIIDVYGAGNVMYDSWM